MPESDGEKITSYAHQRQSLMTCGIFWSTDSTSFENRDKIRPTGVVSNMVMGDFSTLSSSSEWSTRAACKVPSAGARSEKNDVKPAIGQFSRCAVLDLVSDCYSHGPAKRLVLAKSSSASSDSNERSPAKSLIGNGNGIESTINYHI